MIYYLQVIHLLTEHTPYKLSEDVLKNIPMYNWESVANRIRNSFGISGGLGATGTYIYLRNEKGSR